MASKMTRQKRIKTLGEQFVSAMAAKPLPSEAAAMNQLADEELFKVDTAGSLEPVGNRAEQIVKPKKSSRMKPLHPGTLKQIEKLAEVKKSKETKPAPEEIRPEYEAPILKDFWAAGEGGLPPAKPRAILELQGKNPAEVLNEWNIHTTEMLSANRTRRIHDRNKKAKPTSLVDLAGLSYNPTAEAHAQALASLVRVEEKKTKKAKLLKKREEDVAKLRKEVRKREAKKIKDKDSDDEEEEEIVEESEEPVRDRKNPERKTKPDRHREKKVRKLEGEKASRDKEKKLLNDLNQIKSIAKEVEKERIEREKKLEEIKAAKGSRPTEPFVLINGRKVPKEKLTGPTPLPAVLAPTQLPDKMRRIPGVGGIIEEEYLKLREQGVVESGRPAARGKKAAHWKKARTVDKFNLDTMTKRVAQPRFKVPAKFLVKKDA